METHIGDLVLTSELTSSNWGDKHLFFRHQVVFSVPTCALLASGPSILHADIDRNSTLLTAGLVQDMAEDVALVPAWEQFLDKFGLEHESGCPVAGRRRRGRGRGRRADHL